MILASVSLGTVIGVLLSAFVTGGLARLAVPGPDPMPIWLTILIGLVGSLGGGAIAYGAGVRNAYAIGTASFALAILLVVAYRRFVQRRAIVGRDAYRFPERGLGVGAYRERLHRAGINPDQLGPRTLAGPSPQPAAGPREEPTENPAHFLGLLDELHDAGVLEEEEYAAARTRLLERLRG
ncbi:MAG TPA: SHOCT domain-containing protein [Gaiellaceae bacterium]|nr:SHOCT domain-containing protein [Gaiellaceae bacterium]